MNLPGYGKFTYKSNGIRQQERLVVNDKLANRSIQCGKEFIFGKEVGFAQKFMMVDLPTLV